MGLGVTVDLNENGVQKKSNVLEGKVPVSLDQRVSVCCLLKVLKLSSVGARSRCP